MFGLCLSYSIEYLHRYDTVRSFFVPFSIGAWTLVYVIRRGQRRVRLAPGIIDHPLSKL